MIESDIVVLRICRGAFVDYPGTIKKYREKYFMSQADLAKKLGVSYVSVNRWENGHFEPSLKYKKELCELFKRAKIKIK